MKRLSIALLVGVATVALGAGLASAHTKKFNTEVTINFTAGLYFDTFDGEVNSNTNACERNRQVKVKRVEPGKDPVFGTDISDAQGEWEVSNGFAPPGDYYATVKKKVLKKTNNHKHICKADKSPTIVVP